MAKNSEKAFLALVVGLAAGYAAGILTAPKSGAETREDLKQAADKFKKEANDKLSELQGELDHLIDEANAKAKELTGKAKKELEDVVDKAHDAKAKSKKVLTAVKNGDSDSAELQKAITEVKAAKKHLLGFIRSK